MHIFPYRALADMNGKKLLSYYVENNFLDKFMSSIHRHEKPKSNPKFLPIKLRHQHQQ
jgi:hypothetical protein